MSPRACVVWGVCAAGPFDFDVPPGGAPPPAPAISFAAWTAVLEAALASALATWDRPAVAAALIAFSTCGAAWPTHVPRGTPVAPPPWFVAVAVTAVAVLQSGDAALAPAAVAALAAVAAAAAAVDCPLSTVFAADTALPPVSASVSARLADARTLAAAVASLATADLSAPVLGTATQIPGSAVAVGLDALDTASGLAFARHPAPVLAFLLARVCCAAEVVSEVGGSPALSPPPSFAAHVRAAAAAVLSHLAATEAAGPDPAAALFYWAAGALPPPAVAVDQDAWSVCVCVVRVAGK